MKHVLIVLLLSSFVFGQQWKNKNQWSDQEIPKTNTIFGGIGMPQSDFSSTTSDKAGYAKLGGIAGYEIFNNNIVGTLAYAMNPGDDGALNEQWQSMFGSNSSASFEGNYSEFWLMGGYGFEPEMSGQIKVYGYAQGGLLFASMPDIKAKVGSSTITQTTSYATAFAFGVGAGIKINNQFVVGIRYYSGEPEYTQKATSGSTSTEAKVKLPCTLLAITAGILF
jgi:hypothetical protein